MRRLIAVLLVLTGLVVMPAAGADLTDSSKEVKHREQGTEVRAYLEVADRPHRSGTRAYTCTYRQAGVFPVPITIPDLVEFAGGHEGEFVEDFYYWMFCRNGADELVAFHPAAGGAVCAACDRGGLGLSPGGRRGVLELLGAPIADATAIALGDRAARDVIAVVASSYEHHGGFRLRTLSA